MADLQNASQSQLMVLIIRKRLWSSYGEILTFNAITTQKIANFQYTVERLYNVRFWLVLQCLPSERHCGALAVKLSLNHITTQKMTNLKNSFTLFRNIVFN